MTIETKLDDFLIDERHCINWQCGDAQVNNIEVGRLRYQGGERRWQKNVCTDRYSFSVVTAGHLWYQDSTGVITMLKAGDRFQRHPSCCHSTCAVEGELYEEWFVSLPDSVYLPLTQLEIIPSWQWCRALPNMEVLGQFHHLKQYANLAPNAVPEFLIALQRCFLTWLHQESQSQHRNDWLNVAKTQLSENWLTPIHDIAAELKMSEVHFRRQFKYATGTPPHQYRMLQRLSLAKSLLEQANIRVIDVADCLAYPDVSSFSKQFKRHYGIAPSQITPPRISF